VKTANPTLTNSTLRSAAFTLALVGFLVSPASQYAAQCQAPPRAQVRTIHDVFTDIGMRVSAFGGMFVDEEKDTLYVYLAAAHPGDLSELDQAITDVLGSNRPPLHHLEVLQGVHVPATEGVV